MAHRVKGRPFDNFRVAITDPRYFFGRRELVQTIEAVPFQVRVLLGGRRFGKTSALHAIAWSLLDPEKYDQAFPVYINLQLEQPRGVAHLRFLLIARLREAIDRWERVPRTVIRDMYQRFLAQVDSVEVGIKWVIDLKVKFRGSSPGPADELSHDEFRQAFLTSLEDIHKWHFQGICFMLNEAEFITQNQWADAAWSYFRGLKDTDTAVKPFLGLVLSGYRDLKAYKQRVGSPLRNIADIIWLTPLTESQIRQLSILRQSDENVNLSHEQDNAVYSWAGGHPYLAQQMLNAVFDVHLAGQQYVLSKVVAGLLRRHNGDFGGWWNADKQSDGFDDAERAVYYQLAKSRQGSAEDLAPLAALNINQAIDALEVLAGTGVIGQLDEARYAITTQLFEEWVKQQGTTSTGPLPAP